MFSDEEFLLLFGLLDFGLVLNSCGKCWKTQFCPLLHSPACQKRQALDGCLSVHSSPLKHSPDKAVNTLQTFSGWEYLHLS